MQNVSSMQTSSSTAPMIQQAQEKLNDLLTAHNVPPSHGLGHALAVLGHLQAALQSAKQSEADPASVLSSDRQLACELAALLHDADDRKYFGNRKTSGKEESSQNQEGTESSAEGAQDKLRTKYPNAATICKEVGVSEHVSQEVLTMISYVSTQENGNSVPEIAKTHPEYLWPRWSDRLEAIGIIGAVRCYQYNSEKGAPLCVDTTPRPQNEEQLWKEFVMDERFENYQRSGGKSDSMMDHYYDKLLQIANFKEDVVQNQYLVQEAKQRVQPLVDICLIYGQTGEVPEDMIKSYIKV